MKTYRDFSEIKGAHALGTVVKVLLPKEQEYVLYADGWHKRTFEEEQITGGGGSGDQFGYFEFDGNLAGRTVVDIPVNDKTIRYVKMSDFPISFPDHVGVTFYGGKESDPIKYTKGESGDIVYYGGGQFPDIVCIKKGAFANVSIPEDGIYSRYSPDWYISKCELYEIDTPKCWQVDHREDDMLDGEYPIKWESGKVFELPMKDLDTEAVYQMSLVLMVDGYKSHTLLEQMSVFFNGSTWFGYGKNVNVELFYSPRGGNIYCRVTEVNPAITILYDGNSTVPELVRCVNHRTEVAIKKLEFYEQGRIYDDVVRFRLGNNIESGQVSVDGGEIIFCGDEVFVNCSQEADSAEAISTMRVPMYLLPIIIQKKLNIEIYRHHTGYKWRDSEQTIPDNYCAVWSNGDGTVDIETKIQSGTEFRERLEFYLRMDN